MPGKRQNITNHIITLSNDTYRSKERHQAEKTKYPTKIMSASSTEFAGCFKLMSAHSSTEFTGCAKIKNAFLS